MNKKNIVAAILACCLLLFFIKRTSAQTHGFIQQEIIKTQGVLTDSEVYVQTINQKQTTRVYYDGLGRGVQTVAVQASPLQRDLIQPVAYDNLGRQTISYLPYAGKSGDVMGSYRPNAISTDQPAFYNAAGQYLIPIDTAAHSRVIYEGSPLQRLLAAGMTGTGFQPTGSGPEHYKTIDHRPNKNGDSVLVWNPDGTYNPTHTFYLPGSLFVTDGKDEDGVETLIFADLEGHTILKRQILSTGNLNTYYIYNMAGLLFYIVPPLAVVKLAANGYHLDAAPLSNLVFKFAYDNKGRMISKAVPGKGTTYIVYDPLNRPVLMQDANMALKNQWNYIKYDTKGHAVSQGIYTDAITSPSHIGYANMQAYVNTLNYSVTWCETRTYASAQVNHGYYTNNVFPTGSATGTSITPLAYTYFDDYAINNASNIAAFTYKVQADPSLPNEDSVTTAPIKGLPSITSKTIVGAGLGAGTWITTAVLYDKSLNPIQTQSNNHLYHPSNFTLNDVKTVVPDFMGVTQADKVIKQTSVSAVVTVYDYLAYDHMYRLLSAGQRYNTGGQSTIAAYTYNEIGQVVKKGLGLLPGSAYLQQPDMRYNIRGQLLSINNSKLNPNSGVDDDDPNPLFGMQILYNGTDASLSTVPRYNGDISAVKWMGRDGANNKSYERSYSYTYDAADRYKAAVYNERATAATGSFTITHGWDEVISGYDQNGNITALTRNKATQNFGTATQIDNLVYAYDPNNPNQLLTVTDGTDSVHTNSGFRNLTDSTGNYGYDTNGNLTADHYKGLRIAYDFLNRTDKIVVTTGTNEHINYTYDAAGALIRKQAYNSGTLLTTTDYIDGFVYLAAGTDTAALSYFPMPEGRVVVSGSTFTQQFVITDQQGNARITFQNNGSNHAVVIQENSYYGLGMILPNSPVSTPATPNKRLYNGESEWQNDYNNLPDYYQTFNRNYDAAIGRFVAVDPQAESAESMNGYQYAGNNPIMNNDPLGDMQRDYAPLRENIPNSSMAGILPWDAGGRPSGSGDGSGDSGAYGVGFGDGSGNVDATGTLIDVFGATDRQLITAAQNGNVLALNEYASRHGTQYTWDSNGGDIINEAQWTSLGNDPAIIDRNKGATFFSGAWTAQANQGGQPPLAHGAGTLIVNDLLDQYENGYVRDYKLTKSTFNSFINAMRKAGKLKDNTGVPVPNVKGLYQVVVDTRGTSYYYAVGLTTIYYNDKGYVGYADWWNFDPKPWGTRTFWGEVATRYGSSLFGQPFMVIYGITPPEDTLPKH